MQANFTRMPGLAATALAVAVAVAAAGESAPQRHRTQFDIRFGALSVGEATIEVAFNEQRYELKASGRTVGVADLLAQGKGNAVSTGRIEAGRIIAQTSDALYFEKQKKSSVHLEFDNGLVTKVAIVADKKKNRTGPKWVEVNESHLRAVMDPASSIVVPVPYEQAKDPKAVCNRTLSLYDGETRYDIALSYKTTKPVSTQGYEGYAYVCRMKYVPVAGHKRKEKNVEYMAANDGMEIWLAPMQATNLFSPIRVEVPTWIGRISAVPAYFGQGG
jgi:hypothetical protein